MPRCSARSVWEPRDLQAPWRSEASQRSTNFRRAPVVGVPNVEVANTLVQWLRWMAGSYVVHLDTKKASLMSAFPANQVGCHGCMTF
jgi:chorismate mutase